MNNLPIVILFTITSLISLGQNLVNNHSFEKYTKCPSIWNDIKYVPYWENSAKFFSCDYFNTCGIDCVYIYKPFNASKNFAGYQKPMSGYGYAGFYARSEFLISKLKDKLQLDHEYYVETYVSLADYSTKATNNLGFLFTSEEINNKNIDKYKFNAQIIISDFIDDKRNWVKISGNFISSGSERYIAIGNFSKKKKYKDMTNKNQVTKISIHAYYYIDDIKVICIDCKKEEETLIIKNNNTLHNNLSLSINENDLNKFNDIDSINDVFTLKNLFFKTDSLTILKQSFKELNQLVSYLERNQEIKIEIRGHSDNIGDEKYNIELSKNRAKAVMNYFISKGIKKSRLTYKGYGSLKPVASNKNEQGKAKNRRVEIELVD